ncbi:MAG: LysE family translocator [Chromatiales bacterium]|nr:LysE family translocator [Chromatiales bacterium]
MEVLLPLASFAFVSSITPGPNNLMLSASGIAFGVRRTVPHMLGVTAGFAVLIVLCSLGVGSLIAAQPAAGTALRIFGSLYLLYLAWTMRGGLVPGSANAPAKPLNFVQAAVFQFVNPKAWVMAVTAVSLFLPMMQPQWFAVLAVCLIFVVVGLPCIWAWALLGATLRRRLENEAWQQGTAIGLGVLLLYTIGTLWV